MNKVCSIFSQVLRLFSRGDFEKAVKKHKAGRHARGFTSWGQFMAMLFFQLGAPIRCVRSAADWPAVRGN
jgi:hypothetical protein